MLYEVITECPLLVAEAGKPEGISRILEHAHRRRIDESVSLFHLLCQVRPGCTNPQSATLHLLHKILGQYCAGVIQHQFIRPQALQGIGDRHTDIV